MLHHIGCVHCGPLLGLGPLSFCGCSIPFHRLLLSTISSSARGWICRTSRTGSFRKYPPGMDGSTWQGKTQQDSVCRKRFKNKTFQLNYSLHRRPAWILFVPGFIRIESVPSRPTLVALFFHKSRPFWRHLLAALEKLNLGPITCRVMNPLILEKKRYPSTEVH